MYICVPCISWQFWENKTIKTMFVTMNDLILYEYVHMDSCWMVKFHEMIERNTLGNVSLRKSSDAIHIYLGIYINDRDRENMTDEHTFVEKKLLTIVDWNLSTEIESTFSEDLSILSFCCPPRMGEEHKRQQASRRQHWTIDNSRTY